jgi:hypothetical protein
VINTLVTKVNDKSTNKDIVQNTNNSGISILSPDVFLTRGINTMAMPPDAVKFTFMASVTPPEGVIALKVNNREHIATMTDGGVFESTVELQSEDTPVNIVAIRKNGKKNIEQFVAIRNKFEAVKARHFDELFTRRLRDDLGDYYALVIGNNNYTNLDNLTTAVQDATKIASVLKNKYGYKVKLITNADQYTMLSALSEYEKKLGKYDNLMVYYAGHGLIDDDTNEGYWIPTDASLTDKTKWIPNKEISNFMAQMKAKHVMVVADSCYSGTLSGSSISPLPENVENEDILFTSRVKARTVLTSGGLQPILDSGGNGHSIFASAFLDVLKENDRVMEGYSL